MPQISPPFDDRGLPRDYPFDDTREILPREVKKKLDGGARPGEDLLLIDCRLPREWELTRIEGARLIPLQEMQSHLTEELLAKREVPTVVYCRSGQRSLAFARALQARGFTDVRSMAGGILLWNQDVAPGGPLY